MAARFFEPEIGWLAGEIALSRAHIREATADRPKTGPTAAPGNGPGRAAGPPSPRALRSEARWRVAGPGAILCILGIPGTRCPGAQLEGFSEEKPLTGHEPQEGALQEPGPEHAACGGRLFFFFFLPLCGLCGDLLKPPDVVAFPRSEAAPASRRRGHAGRVHRPRPRPAGDEQRGFGAGPRNRRRPPSSGR